MKFIHTADWHLGKPFSRFDDETKRVLVQQARFEAIERIGQLAEGESAEFLIVAGDLLDSCSADKSTVVSACSAIGGLGLPVYVVPGNHDHAGPGSIWGQEFFLKQKSELAPNLAVLSDAGPVELDSAVLLPCPLYRKTSPLDPTEWLRQSEIYQSLPKAKPRIAVAHGSVQSFIGQWIDDEDEDIPGDLIDLEGLPAEEIDYVALGDWHGTKEIAAKAWYAGTPELERIPKSDDHDPGNILAVDVGRGVMPKVMALRSAQIQWHDLAFDVAEDGALLALRQRVADLTGTRANEDVLRLDLTGSLGLEAYNELQSFLESLEARLLRLRLEDRTRVAPTEAEILSLTARRADPLIARVASRLVIDLEGRGEEAAIKQLALRELFAAAEEAST